MLKKLFSVITAIAAFSVLMFGAETVTGSSMISVSANAAQTGISIAELDAIKSRYNSHGYYLKKYYSHNTKTVVKDLQRMLNEEGGYSRIEEDGIFGPATEQSVKSFQSRYSLTVDGIAGKNTYAKLFEILYARANDNSDNDGTVVITGGLDIDAILAYAKQHWSSYNSHYRSYKYSDSDCCNFVSQLLIAGGLSENDRWHGSYDHSNVTSSFKYIPDLISYLRSEYGIGYYTKNSNLINNRPSSYDRTSFSVSDIEVGDCVTIVVKGSGNGYGKYSYGRDHIMMVTGVNYQTGYVYYTAHTTDRYYGISSGGSIHVSGIAGVLKTSDILLEQPQVVETPVTYGDINGDSKVNFTDCVRLLLYLDGSLSSDEIDLKAADVNLDGIVDSEDYYLLRRYNIGLIDTLPYKE